MFTFLLIACLCEQVATGVNLTNVPVTLERNLVAIDTNYHGQTIQLFGTLPDELTGADVILRITNRSFLYPSQNENRTPHSHSPIFFQWKQHLFQIDRFPSLYILASNHPFADQASAEMRLPFFEEELDYPTLKNKWKVQPLSGDSSVLGRDLVFQKLVEIKKKQRLFRKEEAAVQVRSNGHILYTIKIPSKVSVGEYVVQLYVFYNRELWGMGHADFRIEKVGVIEVLHNLSEKSPIQYGFLSVLLSIGTGIFVSFIFSRRLGR